MDTPQWLSALQRGTPKYGLGFVVGLKDRVPKTNGIANPPGYVVVHGQVNRVCPPPSPPMTALILQQKPEASREGQDDLKVKRAWEIALAPAKTSSSPNDDAD
jgi:hypothetical protein